MKPKFLSALKNSCPRKLPEPAAECLPSLPELPEVNAAPFFNDVAARWLELKKPTIKETTFEHYESVFRANIFPAFEGRRIDELKQSDCQGLINSYIEQQKY